MSKYGVFSGPYFAVPGLNTSTVFSPNTGKYGREKTPYLSTLHAVHKMFRRYPGHLFRRLIYIRFVKFTSYLYGEKANQIGLTKNRRKV